MGIGGVKAASMAARGAGGLTVGEGNFATPLALAFLEVPAKDVRPILALGHPARFIFSRAGGRFAPYKLKIVQVNSYHSFKDPTMRSLL